MKEIETIDALIFADSYVNRIPNENPQINANEITPMDAHQQMTRDNGLVLETHQLTNAPQQTARPFAFGHSNAPQTTRANATFTFGHSDTRLICETSPIDLSTKRVMKTELSIPEMQFNNYPNDAFKSLFNMPPSPSESDSKTPKRAPKCAQCKVHGNSVLYKNHKDQCPYRDCTCDKCANVIKKRESMAFMFKERKDKDHHTSRHEKRKIMKVSDDSCLRCQNHGHMISKDDHKCIYCECKCRLCTQITTKKKVIKAFNECKVIGSVNDEPNEMGNDMMENIPLKSSSGSSSNPTNDVRNPYDASYATSQLSPPNLYSLHPMNVLSHDLYCNPYIMSHVSPSYSQSYSYPMVVFGFRNFLSSYDINMHEYSFAAFYALLMRNDFSFENTMNELMMIVPRYDNGHLSRVPFPDHHSKY